MRSAASTKNLTDRVTQLEDSIQEIQDMLRQMNEQTEKRLQSLLAVVHEWVTAYERSTGRVQVILNCTVLQVSMNLRSSAWWIANKCA